MAPRALPCLILAAGALSCNPVGFGAVSFSPIYSYVEGCIPIVVRGSGFENDVAVTIGGSPLESLSLPDPATEPLNVGYDVYGVVPAAAAKGEADVLVTSGANKATIKTPFYYVECPADGQVDAAYPYDGVKAGDTVSLYGCNLDATRLRVQVGWSEPVPFTTTCRTAEVSFTAPDMPPGNYAVHILDADGNIVFPSIGCGNDLGMAVRNTPHPGPLLPPADTGVDTGSVSCANPSISYAE